jgi:hypothetical protein
MLSGMAIAAGTGEDFMKFLTEVGGRDVASVGIVPFLFLLAISLASSFYISFLYTHFFEKRSTGTRIHRAFPLLGVSVTTIFICIQFSLPLSFGLLGALSIVRFRTPVKEPEEIGFIMLIIAAAISCATLNLVFLGLMLVVATAALYILQQAGGAYGTDAGRGMIILAMDSAEYRARGAEIIALLGRTIQRGQLDSVSESAGEATITYSFTRLLPPALPALERQLAEAAPGARVSIFFNRPGGL